MKYVIKFISIILISTLFLIFVLIVNSKINFIEIPYMTYISGFVSTEIGIIICEIIPAVLIFIYLLVEITDFRHDTSKHKKMINRKRQRRRTRYIQETNRGRLTVND
ncbi:MAG TPA: hypothetical protein DD426_08005 [Clostridiaceae bacterium]|nr:hypothetical protein [Clostridiaceae bacterium]